MIMPQRYTEIRALAAKLMTTANWSECIGHEVKDLLPEERRALNSMAQKCHVCDMWFGAHEIVGGACLTDR